MRLFLLCIISVIYTEHVAKDSPKYPISEIPKELMQGAPVVIRENTRSFTIHSRNKATLSVVFAATIFNAKGKDYADQIIGYDKLTKINNFAGSSYDIFGKVIKKLKSSEIYDQSSFDGFSLFSDNRLKAASLAHSTYPYTVEYVYEIEYKYLFMIPTAWVVPEVSVPVQNFSYTLTYPKDIKPRYKTFHITEEPVIKAEGDSKESVTWKLSNIEAIKIEPASYAVNQIFPRIIAAPSKFEYDSFVGEMDSWQKFGNWIRMLNNGRGNLSQETIKKVNDLVSPFNTTEEKVAALYKYLQSTTRYVSIQLGIGGFQPFEASTVEKNGYGDCKALSNYMISLLDAAGIKSYYTLINAGENATHIDEAFPSSQFNHVIVAVPNVVDTLWLECTSQTNPFGYLGSFTGNRKALMITEEGATIVNTTRYSGHENKQIRIAHVTLKDNGDATANVKTKYQGLLYETGGLNFVANSSANDQKEWLHKSISIPVYDIQKYSFTDNKKRLPVIAVDLDLDLKKWASISGKRIFITPNLMTKSNFIPEKNDKRKSNIVITKPYTLIDTIRYYIPETIHPEHLPENINLKSRFGEYSVNYIPDQGSLLYIRKLRVFNGEYQPETYQEYYDFFREINRQDNSKVVFLTKT
ncbi:MAG TPA: DUF3857 domain-containing protein [Cyclobacteriaceae bacterium]|nr:DUF3857 domain-containing protein [Cyclobacteriaceae bacterium]